MTNNQFIAAIENLIQDYRSTAAPLFAPQPTASEQKIFKNEFGSFRRI